MKKAIKWVSVAVLVAIILLIMFAPEETEARPATSIIQPIPFEEIVAHDIDKIFISWSTEQEKEQIEKVTVYDIGLEEKYQIYLQELCADYNIDFFLMASLIFSESSFRANAVGDGGNSIGFCQINKVWWEDMEKKGLDVNDPYDNLEIGCIIFGKLLEKTGDAEKAIQYYKCGEKRGKKLWNEGKKLSSIEKIIERAEEWKNANN